MSTPTRVHQLPLDARSRIGDYFTGKFDKFDVTKIQVPSPYRTEAQKNPHYFILSGIPESIPVTIDWVTACQTCIKHAKDPHLTYADAVSYICDAISERLFPALQRRMIISKSNRALSEWQQKYVAANIQRIHIRVVKANDVDIFVRAHVLHVELSTLRKGTYEQLDNKTLWNQIFDDVNGQRLTADSLKALSIFDTVSSLSKTSTVISGFSTTPNMTPATSKANSIASEFPIIPTRSFCLPSAASLPGPYALLTDTPPYTLLICTPLINQVTIESNHIPTVMLFGEYFQKADLEMKTDRVAMGAGLMLTITDRKRENVKLSGLAAILTFAEKVCGFRMVIEACTVRAGGGWYFRRDEGFQQ